MVGWFFFSFLHPKGNDWALPAVVTSPEHPIGSSAFSSRRPGWNQLDPIFNAVPSVGLQFTVGLNHEKHQLAVYGMSALETIPKGAVDGP